MLIICYTDQRTLSKLLRTKNVNVAIKVNWGVNPRPHIRMPLRDVIFSARRIFHDRSMKFGIAVF